MKIFLPLLLAAAFPWQGFTQIIYSLRYTDSVTAQVQVEINFPKPVPGATQLIMPRSVPGMYAASDFQRYIKELAAVTTRQDTVSMQLIKYSAARWGLGDTRASIRQIMYTVDIREMEKGQQNLTGTSIIRSNFAYILNSSVFAWAEGTELQPVTYAVQTFAGWPVFNTIRPKETMPARTDTLQCKNYFELADGQTLLGPAMRVKEYAGIVPIYVANFCETQKEYIDNFGTEAVASLSLLHDYLGPVPFSHYTTVKIAIVPLQKQNGAFALEHMQSFTLLTDTSFIFPARDTGDIKTHVFGVLHHMCHAWFPLRCYGDSYSPHVEEIPPVIKNIWFNEGFVWGAIQIVVSERRCKFR